jgi:hypothetical protein
MVRSRFNTNLSPPPPRPRTSFTNLNALALNKIARQLTPSNIAKLRLVSKQTRNAVPASVIRLRRLEKTLNTERRELREAMINGLHDLLSYNMMYEAGLLTNNNRYHRMLNRIKASLPAPFGSILKSTFLRFMKKYPGFSGRNTNGYKNINSDSKLFAVLLKDYKTIRKQHATKKYTKNAAAVKLINAGGRNLRV